MPPRSTNANTSLSPQHDDQQSVVLRRRSSSDLARQKFGTMPLLPIRGDDSGATLLSANQTLVSPYPQHVLNSCSLPFPLSCCRRRQRACVPDAHPLATTLLSTFFVPSLSASVSCCLTLSLSLPPLFPTPPVSSGGYTTGGPYPCSL